MPPDGELAAQGGNNSSDFVRKLYKMLEDPVYSSVVRWGNDGDSFVVLENEKFTKSILPKHFKHSNFASFVRQLNKYDFHKVRQNEENGQSPYPASAWEFKHPEFHKHKKDNLDNIRRKAPAPRKPAVTDEAFPAAQQIALLNEALSATQHQVQALQEQYFQLIHSNRKMTEQMLAMQKHVAQQRQIQAEILGHLSTNDERRRNSRHSAHSSHSSHSGQFHPGLNLLPDSADEPAPELRRAKELLGEVSGELPIEGINMFYPGSPPDSATSSVMYNQAATAHPAGMGMVPDSIVDMRHAVYPVGQTQGIDPMHSDHIHNIPYTRPQSTPNAMAEAGSQITPPPAKDVMGWGKQPRILLVEDDKICARIGAKFLTQVDCVVDTASDGDSAVSKINKEPERYDLIFMDIIMPVFDGVSATACIRLVNNNVPIVAMTSNIRGEDIAMYYQWGMNDVLAKPFTREGMIRILRKHLSSLLKNPPPIGSVGDDGLGPTTGVPGQTVSTPAYSSSGAMSMGSMGGPPSIATPSTTVKYETTPIQSPATTSSWHSPGQMTHHTSPHADGGAFLSGGVHSAAGMILTPGGTQRPTFPGGPPPPMSNPPIRGMPDSMHGDDRPEKRQRLYGPGQGQYS